MKMKVLRRGFIWIFGGILTVGLGYLGLAYISALFPTKGRAQIPVAGPPLYVCAGTVHTDFAIPVDLARSGAYGPVAKLIDADLSKDTYVMIGWGDYRFFTEVQTLSQLTPGIAISALTGRHDTALRIILIHPSNLRNYCRALPLDAQGQNAIAKHIRETTPALDILPKSSSGITYLKSKDRYGIFHTCNDWTSDALRKAGLPTARWHAPFAFSVTRPLRTLPEDWDTISGGSKPL